MSLLTVRGAAQRLGVGYSTLKQWIYGGQIRTTTTAGGHHRIAEAEVERMMARTAPDTTAARPRASTGLIVALSGRNRLRGFVDEVRIDGLMAQVRLRIGDQSLTAVITADAIEEMKLRRGQSAIAIIKSTEVMIARERETARDTRVRATGRRRRSSRYAGPKAQGPATGRNRRER
jgi:molybdopterin-binding protein